MKRRKPRKKWGMIGAPKSAKRRRFMRKIARRPRKKSTWRQRGYKSKRAYLLDRARRAKYRPAKKYRKGRGNKGDWSRKRYRKKKR